MNLIIASQAHAGETPAAQPPLLRVTALRKSYATPQGSLEILSGVDLVMQPGESLALMGESGSGKSTLLHLIAALDSADGGQIWVDGRALTGLSETGRAAMRRDTFGIVFQQFNLIPSLTVADNIAFQSRLAGRYDKAWLAQLTRRLGLTELTHRYPEQLSGGQQQRVAIGRAMGVRPRLLLADEPTGNLDEATGDSVLGLILELVAMTGCGFLMVTHSHRLAQRLYRQLTLSVGKVASP